MSDEAVLKSTGQSWAGWFALLDGAGGCDMSHREMVAYLKAHSELSAWWQQMVAVTYEQARGLRDRHEKTDGYQISVSKTIAVPLATLFKAWSETKKRKDWLGENITIRKQTVDKSLRITWSDNASSLDVMVYEKGESKSQVTVNHSKLADTEAAGRAKEFWRERLTDLKKHLEQQ